MRAITANTTTSPIGRATANFRPELASDGRFGEELVGSSVVVSFEKGAAGGATLDAVVVADDGNDVVDS